MGNRAVITFSQAKSAPCIYVHWNGGRASVLAFLSAARKLGLRHVTRKNQAEFFKTLHSIIRVYLGHSAYLETYGSADTDNYDNGVYIIDSELNISGRRFTRGSEEINAEKTREIESEILARAPIFND